MIDLNELAEKTVLDLLDTGIRIKVSLDDLKTTQGDDLDIETETRIAKSAIGYLDAANALLLQHAQLHRKLIEHPSFKVLRSFERNYRPFLVQ